MLVAIILTSLAAAAVFAQLADPAGMLTPADLAQVGGQNGFKTVPHDPKKGAGGDLNFSDSSGRLVLILNLLDDNSPKYAKKDYESAKAMKGFWKEDLKGLGDEAFVGPAVAPPISALRQEGQLGVQHRDLYDPRRQSPDGPEPRRARAPRRDSR
jgi:hypothetical protein